MKPDRGLPTSVQAAPEKEECGSDERNRAKWTAGDAAGFCCDITYFAAAGEGSAGAIDASAEASGEVEASGSALADAAFDGRQNFPPPRDVSSTHSSLPQQPGMRLHDIDRNRHGKLE
jgi:hypothetical protein